MQNCGFEDLAQWPSPRPSLKHSCSCGNRFWQNKFPPKARYGVQIRVAGSSWARNYLDAIISNVQNYLGMLYAKKDWDKLELIVDIDMYQFIEKSMSGGISYIANRYRKTNNKYMKTYNKKALKVAEHSFQEPIPNSPLLLSYLSFGAPFLQESRLTTEVFILAFWLRCELLPWQRG